MARFSVILFLALAASLFTYTIAVQTTPIEDRLVLSDVISRQDLGPRCPSACFRRRELAVRSCSLRGSRGCRVRRCIRARGPIRNGRRFRGFRCTRPRPRPRPPQVITPQVPPTRPPPVTAAPIVQPLGCPNICRVLEVEAQADCAPFLPSGACVNAECRTNTFQGFICTPPFVVPAPPTTTAPETTTTAATTASTVATTVAAATTEAVTEAPTTDAPTTQAPDPVSIPPVTFPPSVPTTCSAGPAEGMNMITCSCSNGSSQMGRVSPFDDSFEDCFFECLVDAVDNMCTPPTAVNVQNVIDDNEEACCDGCPSSMFGADGCMPEPQCEYSPMPGSRRDRSETVQCVCDDSVVASADLPRATSRTRTCFEGCFNLPECEPTLDNDSLQGMIDSAAQGCCEGTCQGRFTDRGRCTRGKE